MRETVNVNLGKAINVQPRQDFIVMAESAAGRKLAPTPKLYGHEMDIGIIWIHTPHLSSPSCAISMSIMAPTVPEVEEPPRLPMPSRNPLPLSASQEAQVRELYHSRVRNYCTTEIKGP
jgi:hypothetical protein